MAKQAGPFFFTGTIGDVIFYKQGDQYLVRMKGSYNTKALQKPGARPLMQLKQSEFGQASKLASQVRRQLPKAQRKEIPISRLTGKAVRLLRAGKSGEEIKAILLQKLLPAAAPMKQPEQTPLQNNGVVTRTNPERSKKSLLKKKKQLSAAPSFVCLPLQEYIYKEPCANRTLISQAAAVALPLLE